MAVVNGPLFSLDASGAVGKALVYSKWKGRNVVREYVTPANPRSILQRGRRTMVAILNAIWASMDSTDKDSWADLAAAGNYSTFNGMTSYNLDQQTTNDPPTKNRSDTPTSVTMDITGLSATPGTNRIDFSISVATAQADTYGVVALIEGATAPNKDLLRIVGFYDSTSTGGKTVEVTDLPAGTYSASTFWISNDGSVSGTDTDATSIVVTGTF